MIDRGSRDRLAVGLRHYVAGLITNDDLDGIEVDWRDRGAVAIKERSWQLYSDYRQHHAKGTQAVSKDGKHEIARWIAFLYTDQEYLWPDSPTSPLVNWMMNLAAFGWWQRHNKRTLEQFLQAGDFSVWPFTSRADFENALRRPRLMAGPRE
jgi:hypothetical protein